jgi:single-strand DNA-binding protein
MAKSVNKVFLWGNVDKDPEIQSTPGGTMVANFTLATSDRFQDAQGNWQDRTEWHNLVAFKRLAEIARDYVKKGSKLYIEGKIQTRSWDDKETGVKKYRTEIIVIDLSLLFTREDGSGGGSSRTASADQRPLAGTDDYVTELPYVQQAEISDAAAQQAEITAKRSNRVFLLGNVGKDPEIRSTGGGTMVANFTLATSGRFQAAQGNWQDRTEWHNLVAFKRLAEIVRDYVKKGSKLYLDGKIQTRSWDDKETGAKRYRTEIIVNDLSLLSAREEGGGYSRPSNAPTNMDQRRPAANDEYSQAAEISDDDIPF